MKSPKHVDTFVRPDPQPDHVDPTVKKAAGPIPEHRPNDIEGVIQYKDSPDGPIREKLPTERDLQEGKITPAAVNTPDPRSRTQYDGGVTQEDIDHGRVSPSAVRVRTDRAITDHDTENMITLARNKTQLSRLNHEEAIRVFEVLKAEGYIISRADVGSDRYQAAQR